MPKNRKVVKISQAMVLINEPRKFRIGSRKGGKSAHVMSSKELRDILKDEDRKRDRSNATAILRLRGVAV